MNRLAEIKRDAAACTICRDAPRKAALPHPARPIFRLTADARVLIASQAPGARAHASGVPFDDPSGVRLRSWLAVTSEEFYDPARFAILPMGFCFPGHDLHGGDLPPRAECRGAWHDAIMAELPALALILMIGRFAQNYHLRRAGYEEWLQPRLTQTVGAWRGLLDAGGPPRLMALPHPSWRNTGWLKQNPWFAAELLPELQQQIRHLIG